MPHVARCEPHTEAGGGVESDAGDPLVTRPVPTVLAGTAMDVAGVYA